LVALASLCTTLEPEEGGKINLPSDRTVEKSSDVDLVFLQGEAAFAVPASRDLAAKVRGRAVASGNGGGRVGPAKTLHQMPARPFMVRFIGCGPG